MAPNPRRQDERLDALYAELPAVACQGLCHDSCGPIETSVRERTRIESAAGKPLTCGAQATCSMLTPMRRCGVYETRPMICRLWGIVETLKCPYGCKPVPRWLTAAEGARFLLRADQIGGRPGAREEQLWRGLISAIGEDEYIRLAGEIARKTTQRPTLHGRAESLPRTVIDRG